MWKTLNELSIIPVHLPPYLIKQWSQTNIVYDADWVFKNILNLLLFWGILWAADLELYQFRFSPNFLFNQWHEMWIKSQPQHCSHSTVGGVTAGDRCCSACSFRQFLTVLSVAKDMVRKLLVVDPKERMSIAEALQHPWLQVRPAADSQPPCSCPWNPGDFRIRRCWPRLRGSCTQTMPPIIQRLSPW